MDKEKGIYIPKRIIRMIEKGGKFSGLADCIEIDVQTAIDTAKKCEDEDVMYKFLGKQYVELVKDLIEIGLIEVQE